MSTFDAWMTLVNRTKESLFIGSYYWDLNNTNSLGDKIFNAIKSKNVDVRLLQSFPDRKHSNDGTKIFQNQSMIKVRSIDLRGDLGIFHSKFFISDEMHIYLGSANLDWRSLSQFKELGVLIQNCSCLAKELTKIFNIYWNFNNSSNLFDTNVNMSNPLIINFNKNVKERFNTFFSTAPSTHSSQGWTSDLDAIKETILNAKRYIHVCVMKYAPLREFSNRGSKNIT